MNQGYTCQRAQYPLVLCLKRVSSNNVFRLYNMTECPLQGSIFAEISLLILGFLKMIILCFYVFSSPCKGLGMVHLSLFILQCLHQLEAKFSRRSGRETLNKTSLYENGEKTSKVGGKNGSALRGKSLSF